jgi:hypothetical protein
MDLTRTQREILLTPYPVDHSRKASLIPYAAGRGIGIIDRAINISRRSVVRDEIPNTSGGQVSNITINGDQFRVHAFTSVGTNSFTIDRDATVDVLILGGGGGRAGGGGGAGELVFRNNFAISSGSYNIAVGDGGPGSDGGTGESGSTNQNGNISTAFNLTALGGGAGGGDTSGFDGGSGGGQMYDDTSPNSSGNGLSVAVDGVGNDAGYGVGDNGNTS